ncbi:MAG: hypothetical protein U0324_43920 [Polyangiales bacterium]
MSAAFYDSISRGDVVHLVGDVDVHAVVIERQARALVVRWHGHLYRAVGEAVARVESDAFTGRWKVRTFEPWAVARPRKGRAL